MSGPIAASTRDSWRVCRGRGMRSNRRARWRGCCGGRRAPMVAYTGVGHGLASLQPRMSSAEPVISTHVPIARLDAVVRQDVAFVKIDVEGHELNVLNGAVELLERCQPVFLVGAEDRHRAEATRSVFEFFRNKSYRGFFLKDD